MKLEIKATLTPGDMTRSLYFHMLRRTWPLVLIVLLLPVLTIPVGFLMWHALAPENRKDALTNIIPLMLAAAFMGYCFLLNPFLLPRKLLRESPYIYEPGTLSISPGGLVATSPNQTWAITWSVVKAVHETKSSFLLYNTAVPFVIPKRDFATPAELETFRELVRTCAPTRRIEKPGIVARYL